jgi:hypothetical protein
MDIKKSIEFNWVAGGSVKPSADKLSAAAVAVTPATNSISLTPQQLTDGTHK